MIQVIRGIIKSFVTGVYNTFTADGRPDETISGTQYQHYGFSSSPPVGVECISLQYGQNNVSVAEAAGNLVTLYNLEEGDVVLYNTAESRIHLRDEDGVISIYTIDKTNNKTYAIKIDPTNKAVVIGAGNTPSGTTTTGSLLELEEDKATLGTALPGNKESVVVTNSDGLGTVEINRGNFTVAQTPLIPGLLAPVATQSFVTRVCATLAALTGSPYPVLPTDYTQATKAL
jgi:phage gp45-like